MSDNEKAAPNAPTAIGVEQSNQSLNNSIITENSENFECEEVDYQEIKCSSLRSKPAMESQKAEFHSAAKR